MQEFTKQSSSVSSPPLLVAACLVFSLLSPSSTQQLPCNLASFSTHEANTSTPPLSLSCSLPSSFSPRDPFHWQWNKLADGVSPQSSLSSNVSSTPNTSTHMLEAQCSASGHYQASYLMPDGDCIYSCQFFVQVTEVRRQQILLSFSNITIQTSLPAPSSPDTHTTNYSYPAFTADILLGTCSSRYYLVSGCSLAVTATWFKNGAVFEPDLNQYSMSLSETVAIHNLTDVTEGYYVCVTELPYALGSYRTEDVDIKIGIPVPTSTPSPTTLPPSMETTPTTGSSDSLILGLKTWEVGLIAANMAVVLTLFLCVCSVTVCVSHRGPRDPEHFSLKELEEDEEFVDFPTPVEIPFNAIVFHELLHKGTFKTVHHAIVNHSPRGMTGLEVAVKRLKDESSELGSDELMAEAYILKSIQDKAGVHPHLVSLVGVTSTRGPPCLLLEYMPHGTLDRFLWSLKKGPVPEWYLRQTRDVIQDQPYHKHVSCDLLRVTLQVAEGMCFLANHGFVHHDLSTRNVLVEPHLCVKIGNPGMHHEGYYYVVSEREHFLHDMAPECLWEKRFSLFSDVWSFGILLYKMVTLETNPYPGVLPRDLYDHIVVNNQRPRLLSSFSNELYFLLQQCWQVVPLERPTFPLLLGELRRLYTDPTKHIILRTSKDEYMPGYVSENGQVFLHSVPSCIFQPGYAARRLSYTQRSGISSADDTIYSRETAESILYLYSSEVESTYTGRETDEDEEEGTDDDPWDWTAGKQGERGGVGTRGGERGGVGTRGGERGGVGTRGEERGRGPLCVIGKDMEACGEDVTLITESNIDDAECQSQESHDKSCDQELEDRDSSKEKLVYL